MIIARMNFTPADKLVDDVWGPIGTHERDVMEAQLKEDVQSYFLRETIKTEWLKHYMNIKNGG